MRLRPFLPRLSCIVFISLGWDEARLSLTQRVRARRVGCRVLRVLAPREQAGDTPASEVTALTVAEIESGEALLL